VSVGEGFSPARRKERVMKSILISSKFAPGLVVRRQVRERAVIEVSAQPETGRSSQSAKTSAAGQLLPKNAGRESGRQ